MSGTTGIGLEALLLGVAAVALSGIVNGTFLYPMRLVKRWKWEHAWLAFSLFGLFLFPLAIAFLTVPSLSEVYSICPRPILILALVLGLGFGAGSLLFGLGISALGLSLGNAIVMGTMAIFGTLVPAIVLEPRMLATTRGLQLEVSLGLIMLGLMSSSIAGSIRDRVSCGGAEVPSFRILGGASFKRGLVLCLLSGVLSACFNLGFALTAEISNAAVARGSSASSSAFAVWALVMGAGSLPNLAYCWYLIEKNSSFDLFRSGLANWFYVLVMSCLWVLSIKLYGDGAIHMGSRGATIAWPILVSSTILSATILGLLTAEWRGSDRRVRMWLSGGLTALLGAVLLAGLAGVS